MGIGGSLMTGWTFLLLGAIKQPLERRLVIFFNGLSCISGLSVVALNNYMSRVPVSAGKLY
jgi:hypothetical protein